MKDWQRIRLERPDITDYVIHFTKYRLENNWPDAPNVYRTAAQVFGEIVRDGFIRPTFSPRPNRYSRTPKNTVRGPYPAVCLTEQPLSAVAITRKIDRYSGFGVAYHKYALYQKGGQPVIYGPESMLGRKLGQNEAGYQEGKEIYTGGLPAEHQYLFVNYKPTINEWDDYPVDFTWEREWRYKCNGTGLPLYLEEYEGIFKETPVGALVVEFDWHIEHARGIFATKLQEGATWAGKMKKIVSLETVERMLKAGDTRYARIETYPDE